MNELGSAVREIEAGFDASRFPEGFLDRYDQLECLASGRGTETFLVRQKDGEKLFVAKCYDKTIYSFIHESGILRGISHKCLPAFEDELESDDTVCIIREYIEGTPLDRYAGQKSLTENQSALIALGLCDILTYLHKREPPVIHRDIKPQNIIIREDGRPVLIDFDIARVYDSGARTDTQFFGTRDYAPPEQYGFSQTDCRADIYSLGVLLGWMLTGETDSREVSDKLGESRFAHIYKKCTAFSPEDRYPSAEKLERELKHALENHRKSRLAVAAAFACVLFFFAGFVTGRYSAFKLDILNRDTMQESDGASIAQDALKKDTAAEFEEPLIEQAVRLQIGKNDGEVITYDDLQSVTGLYVFGDSIISKDQDILHSEAKRLFDEGSMREGPIRSLEDLKKMPGLKEVFICMQQISDISPLAELSGLEIVDVKNNPISDISPLSGLKFLKRVCVFDTRVTDLSQLALCPMLSELDAGKLPIESPEDLAGLERLKTLSLFETPLKTLSGIDKMTQLEYIEIGSVTDGDLSPLLTLPYLKNAVLGANMREAGKGLAKAAKFEISYK
ncbi:MAG: protein kinase [Clostridiaceae bacterium]|nr:protein kinase [Clostridiaceae bacterium]